MKKKIACLLALCLILVMTSAEMTENLDMSNLLNAKDPVSQGETLSVIQLSRPAKSGELSVSSDAVLVNGHVLESGWTFVQNSQAGQEAILPTDRLQSSGFLSLQEGAAGSYDNLNGTSEVILQDDQAYTGRNNGDARIDIYNEGAALFNATAPRQAINTTSGELNAQNKTLQGGAIYLQGNGTIQNSLFLDNHAAYEGGAVFIGSTSLNQDGSPATNTAENIKSGSGTNEDIGKQQQTNGGAEKSIFSVTNETAVSGGNVWNLTVNLNDQLFAADGHSNIVINQAGQLDVIVNSPSELTVGGGVNINSQKPGRHRPGRRNCHLRGKRKQGRGHEASQPPVVSLGNGG